MEPASDPVSNRDRLGAARKVLATLTLEERWLIHTELGQRLSGEPETLETMPRRGYAPGRRARGPKLCDRVEQVIRDNPQGLRNYEIAKLTGQSQANIHGTLKHLERCGRIEYHGERLQKLWTTPGIAPEPRIETIAQAILHVLSEAMSPMDAQELGEKAYRLLASHGRIRAPIALHGTIARLVSTGMIASVGANEHGATYILAEWKGGAATTTLN